MRDRLWRCHDGRVIPVAQMEDDHLAKCIAMIKRGRDARGRIVTRKTAAYLPRLELEVEIRKMGLRK